LSPTPTESPEFLVTLPTTTRARLAVFDVRGRRVHLLLDDVLAAGSHRITWTNYGDGSLSSGRYFARLWTPRQEIASDLIVIR